MVLNMLNYTNEKGMLLVERVLIDPTNQIPFDRFIGTCMIGIQGPDGVHGQQIDFPIKANSIQEAFNNFEESEKAFVNKMHQEASRRVTVAKNLPLAPTHDILKRLIKP
jgi:hypothetical protein